MATNKDLDAYSREVIDMLIDECIIDNEKEYVEYVVSTLLAEVA